MGAGIVTIDARSIAGGRGRARRPARYPGDVVSSGVALLLPRLLACLGAQADDPGTAKAVAGEFVVALDAGHGGSQLGAEGPGGLAEKTVTLDIARRVAGRLRDARGVRVVMCRSTDVMVPIRARVRCGNEAHARLFLSIHANASPFGVSRGMQRGFELYVAPVSDVDEDAAAAVVSHGGKGSVAAAWAARKVRVAAVDALAAARRIEWRLADAIGRASDRGIKQAGASLDVLQGLEVPGVLVEVGFLDHSVEGPELATAAGRERIAAALAEAIVDVRARERRAQIDPAITAQRRGPEAPR